MARESTIQREAIVARAARLFSERGYASTSLRDIMDGFEVSGPAFYYYFKSKEEILAEILDGALTEAEDALERLIADPELSGVSRFQGAMSSHARVIWQNSAAARVLFVDSELASKATTKRIQKRMQSYTRTLIGLYADGVKDGELKDCSPLLATSLILGMANWGAFWIEEERNNSEEVLKVFELLVQGVVIDPGN